MTCSIRPDDIGTSLEITVIDCDKNIVPLATATVMTIRLKGPDNVMTEKTAALVSDGADGKMHYITQENDLSQLGRWNIQGYVELPAGQWSTDIGSFTVSENLV